MKKIKLQYADVASIVAKTKELSFLKGDQALDFYRDRVQMEDAFRPETARLQDLYAQKNEVYQAIDQITEKGEEKQVPRKLQYDLEAINIEIEKVQGTEKKVQITPLPWSKFKEAGLDTMDIVQIFGKIIEKEA